MAAPAFAGTIAKSSTGTTNTASFPITLPSGIQAGEGILVQVSYDQNGVLTVNAGSSSGWEKLDQATQGTTVTAAWFWQPSAAGGGTDSLTVDSTVSDRGTALARRVSGHDAGTLPDIATATGASGNADPPNLAPAAGAKDYLFVAGAALDQGFGTFTAGPASPFTGFDEQAGPTQGASSAWAHYQATGDASEDPGAFTNSSAAWAAATIAIHPAGGGGANVTGTAALATAFTGAAAGQRTTWGTTALTETFTASAAGERTTFGSAALATTFTAAAAGSRTTFGTVAVAVAFNAAASGTTGTVVTGTASLTVAFNAAAAGQRTTLGTATLATTFTGAAAGARTTHGTAALTVAFAAAAASQRTTFAAAALPIVFAAAAAGVSGDIGHPVTADRTTVATSAGRTLVLTSSGRTVSTPGSGRTRA